jgi:hypothetical protein
MEAALRAISESGAPRPLMVRDVFIVLSAEVMSLGCLTFHHKVLHWTGCVAGIPKEALLPYLRSGAAVKSLTWQDLRFAS